MTDLEPISPAEAMEMYMEGRRDELAESTLQGHRYRLEAFVQWCEEEGIDDLRDLGGRELYAYRVWRREGHGEGRDPVEPITLRGQLATLRAFLRFATEIDAVPEGLRQKVPLPTVSEAGQVSESHLEPERAEAILEYLNRYNYASMRHVLVLLMWHTGARTGALRGLDVGDCDLDRDRPGIRFHHRPEQDTPLKNGEKGERWNAVSPTVARIVQDYIEGPRNDLTDEYGRKPLLTTKQGRPAPTTIRNHLYAITRPCIYGDDCPHDKDPETCEWTYFKKATHCPSSRSPHDVRSGRVTAYRRGDVPKQIVSDRLDASEAVLSKHYDRRNEREKSEQRRDYLPDS